MVTTILIIFAGLALAMVVYVVVGLVMQRRDSHSISLAGFNHGGQEQQATQPKYTWQGQAGEKIAARLPISLDVWQDHLRWAQRSGTFAGYSIGHFVFLSLVLGVAGLAMPLLNPGTPTYWFAPLAGIAAPFVRLRSEGNKVRQRTVRQLPELASLVAAELSANATAEESLGRASELPGPLAGLLRDAGDLGQTRGKSLLSHGEQTGILRPYFETLGIPALRAFAVQLDLAASGGVEVPQRMTELSRTLAAEYRQRLFENTEKLETQLTTAVGLFYFAPMMGLVLTPLFNEMMNAF